MATTTSEHRYTIAEAAAFLRRDEGFVRERLADGTLQAAPDQGITWEALVACLATYDPGLAAVIQIAQEAIDTGEYGITIEHLRGLGLATAPDPSDDEGGDGVGAV